MQRLGTWGYFLLICATGHAVPIAAESVPVRYLEGLVHGFLVLRTTDGIAIADGELTQTVQSDRVTDHLILHFNDGSLHEETVAFSQRGTFHLRDYHLVQRGPTFKRPMEMSLSASTGDCTVRYTDEDGKEKSVHQRLKLPPDVVAAGMLPVLLKNLKTGVSPWTLSLVAATPAPRTVKFAVTRNSEESFTAGGTSHRAARYAVKVQLGGVAGLLAPLAGKQPPDTYIWILEGEAPAFVKFEGPLYAGGPIWRMELVSPSWPQETSGAPAK